MNLHRHSIRLLDYDYSQNGAYFITLCINQFRPILGNWLAGKIKINQVGRIVETEWQRIAQVRKYVKLDEYVVMPNHFHGIIIISQKDRSSIITSSQRIRAATIGAIIGQFKSLVTKNVHQAGIKQFQWQRNYFEHIIRNESDLHRIRKYIMQNPVKWELDQYYAL